MAKDGTVLVVDDDTVVRGMLAWLFEDAGYRVLQAGGGAEALDQLREHPPDCLILDLMMPGVDGHAVLAERQAEHLAEATRVVVLTAKTAASDEVWCWEQGADEFITKPFDGERLLALVRRLMHLSLEQLAHRRTVGLSEARRLDALEEAFPTK